MLIMANANSWLGIPKRETNKPKKRKNQQKS